MSPYPPNKGPRLQRPAVDAHLLSECLRACAACTLTSFTRRPPTTTPGGGGVSISQLSSATTPGSHLRHSSSCSWFLRRTGRRQPSTISTCGRPRVIVHSNTDQCGVKRTCVFFFFFETLPKSCPPSSSTARAAAGCCGKMPVSHKDARCSKSNPAAAKAEVGKRTRKKETVIITN